MRDLWLRRKERFEMIKDYDKYLKEIVDACKRLFGEFEVYVFGSVLEDWTAGSDVDILIRSKDVPERAFEKAKIVVEIEKNLPIFHPFEFHLANDKDFEFYKRHIKNMKLVYRRPQNRGGSS